MSSYAVTSRTPQVYIHVDASEDLLEVEVEPVGKSYRLRNDRSGVAKLVDLCRDYGVTKITMRGDSGECEFARHSLSFASVSVTVADPLRENLFAARARRLRKVRRLALVLAASAFLIGVGYWQWTGVTHTAVSTYEKTRKLASDMRRNARAYHSRAETGGASGSATAVEQAQKFRSLFGSLKGRASTGDFPRERGGGGVSAEGAKSKASDWASSLGVRREAARPVAVLDQHGDIAIILQEYANSTAYRTFLAPSGKGKWSPAADGSDVDLGARFRGPSAVPTRFAPYRDGAYWRIFEAADESQGLPPIVYLTSARVTPPISPPNEYAEAIRKALRDLEARLEAQRKGAGAHHGVAAPRADRPSNSKDRASPSQLSLLSYSFEPRQAMLLPLTLSWPIWSRFQAAPADACRTDCLL